MKQERKTVFITGLKALGVLMIVFAHLHYEFPPLPDFPYKLLSFAGYFVVLFFLVSSCTISMSLDRNKEESIIHYMKRRFIRLASLYYVVIPIGVLLRIMVNGWAVPKDIILDVVLHYSFLNLNLIYEPSQSSLLGFEWMVPMLFWFYLLIPFLLYIVRKHFGWFVVIFIVSVFLHTHLDALIQYRGIMKGFRSMQVWIVMYAYSILMYQVVTTGVEQFFRNGKRRIDWVKIIGIAVIFISLITSIQTMSERMYGVALILIGVYTTMIKPFLEKHFMNVPLFFKVSIRNIDVLLLFGILIKYIVNSYYIKNPHLIMLIWCMDLMCCGFTGSELIRMIFENHIMVFFGTISYALYLTHNLAISIIGLIVPQQYQYVRILSILVLATASSYILHTQVEARMQKIMGKYLL